MDGFLRKFCPAELVESVADINVDNFRKMGIDALLIDIDNTLVAWQGYQIPDDIKEWIRQADKEGMKICLVSNTRTKGRLGRIASELGVAHSVKAFKPRRAGFIEGLNLLNVEPARAAVIGDQIFTDIFGGNRLGIYTVLVQPMHRKEFFGTKISRFFERSMLKSFAKRGWIKLPNSSSAEQ